jgi:hypothetical protein
MVMILKVILTGGKDATEVKLCLHGKVSEVESLADQPRAIAILCEVSLE